MKRKWPSSPRPLSARSSEALSRHQRSPGGGGFNARGITLRRRRSGRAGLDALTAPYCVAEALRNARKIESKAPAALSRAIIPKLELVPTELAFDQALVFPKAKDRPVLLSALGAEADCLLTLDEADFQKVIGSHVYGMAVSTPGLFLLARREAGDL